MTEVTLTSPFPHPPPSPTASRLPCGHLHQFTTPVPFTCSACDSAYSPFPESHYSMLCYRHQSDPAVRFCRTHFLPLCSSCRPEHQSCNTFHSYINYPPRLSDQFGCYRHPCLQAVKLCMSHYTSVCLTCAYGHLQCDLMDVGQTDENDLRRFAGGLDQLIPRNTGQSAGWEYRESLRAYLTLDFDQLVSIIYQFLREPEDETLFDAMCPRCRLTYNGETRKPFTSMSCGHTCCEACLYYSEDQSLCCGLCGTAFPEEVQPDRALAFKAEQRKVKCMYHSDRQAVGYCERHRKPVCFLCVRIHGRCKVRDVIDKDLSEFVKGMLKEALAEVDNLISLQNPNPTTFSDIVTLLCDIDGAIYCNRHDCIATFFHIKDMCYACSDCEGDKIDLYTYRISSSVLKKLSDRVTKQLKRLTPTDLTEDLYQKIGKRKQMCKAEMLNLAYRLGRISHEPLEHVCVKCRQQSSSLRRLPCIPGPHCICRNCSDTTYHPSESLVCDIDSCSFAVNFNELPELPTSSYIELLTCSHCETQFHPIKHKAVALKCGHTVCSEQRADFCVIHDSKTCKIESADSQAFAIMNKLDELHIFCSLDGAKIARFYCKTHKEMLCTECRQPHSKCESYDIYNTDVKAILIDQANSMLLFGQNAEERDLLPSINTLKKSFELFEKLDTAGKLACSVHKKASRNFFNTQSCLYGCEDCWRSNKSFCVDLLEPGNTQCVKQILIDKVKGMNFWEFNDALRAELSQAKGSLMKAAEFLHKMVTESRFVPRPTQPSCHADKTPPFKYVLLSCGGSATHAICTGCARSVTYRKNSNTFKCPLDDSEATYSKVETFSYLTIAEFTANLPSASSDIRHIDGEPLTNPSIYDSSCVMRFGSVFPVRNVARSEVDKRMSPWVISTEGNYVEVFTFSVSSEASFTGLTLACPLVPGDQYLIDKADILLGASTSGPLHSALSPVQKTVTHTSQVSFDVRMTKAVPLSQDQAYTLRLRLIPSGKAKMELFSGNFLRTPDILQGGIVVAKIDKAETSPGELTFGSGEIAGPVLGIFVRAVESVEAIR